MNLVENVIENYDQGDAPSFLKLPRKFWIVATGLFGVLLCSIPNWIKASVDFEYYKAIPVKFNFLSLFEDFGETGIYYLFQGNMDAYSAMKIAGFAALGILVLAAILLALALISAKSLSPKFLRFAISGFSLASFAGFMFAVLTMVFSGKTIASGLTIMPIAVFIIPLATIPFLLDPVKVKNKRLSRFLHQKAFFYMIIPIMVYVFIFSYLPLTGWKMAFQNFRPGADQQEWIGFGQFERLFKGGNFWRIMQNTLGMSFINLVLGFTTAIFFALLINEVRQKAFKRTVQTISYLPHFLSWVIAASMIVSFLSSEGILNEILMGLGIINEPKILRADPKNFWWIVGWSGVWKSVGWNTIIYLAAITAIDPELYESAELDGAGRFAKMWFITLPGIKSTILVLVIMNIGWILNAGYEVQYLLGNDLVWSRAETIDVFVIRWGISLSNYSLATALGMFKTVVSIILITVANLASKRFAQESLV